MNKHGTINCNFVLNSNRAIQSKSIIRNYLAFIGNICYFPHAITTTSFLKMSFVGRLKDGFGGAVASLALVATPLAACAQEVPAVNSNDAQITQVAATPEQSNVPAGVEVLEDAHRPANAWVANNPDRVAVSVTKGHKSNPAIFANIESGLEHLFAQEGVDPNNIRIYWEEGKGAATAFNFHSDSYVTAAIAFADVSPETVKDFVKKAGFKPFRQVSMLRDLN